MQIQYIRGVCLQASWSQASSIAFGSHEVWTAPCTAVLQCCTGYCCTVVLYWILLYCTLLHCLELYFNGKLSRALLYCAVFHCTEWALSQMSYYAIYISLLQYYNTILQYNTTIQYCNSLSTSPYYNALTAYIILHTLNCTLYNRQRNTLDCIPRTTHFNLHTKYYTPVTLSWSLNTTHLTLHTAYCTLNTAHYTPDYKKKTFFVNSEIFGIQIWHGKKRINYDKFEIATKQRRLNI